MLSVLSPSCSGIGLAAAKLLVHLHPNDRLVLVCRNKESCERTQSHFSHHNKDRVLFLACDHTSMEDIHAFTETLRQKARIKQIDCLCLNAAYLAPKDSPPQFTDDGLEVTFQTNYLSMFLLANLLVDLVPPSGRIIMCTSGLHEQTSLNLDASWRDGRVHKGFAMLDGSDFHFKTSYAVSKLCVVGLCAQLASRHPDKYINCFSPGLMTDSGLFRHQRTSNNHQHSFSNPDVLKRQKTVQWGAGSLVYMIQSPDTAQRSGEFWRDATSTLGSNAVYGTHFCPTPIRMDAQIQSQLWELSRQLSGL